MTNALVSITDVRIEPASERDVASGLLGWISFVLDGEMIIDGLTLRRTLDGKLTLSWPARRDRKGIDHPIVRPYDDAARVFLERKILTALGYSRTR